MIVFYEVKTGERLGSVKLVDGVLVAEGAVRSIVDAWVINRRKSPESFMVEYARGGNGYVESSLIKGRYAAPHPGARPQ